MIATILNLVFNGLPSILVIYLYYDQLGGWSLLFVAIVAWAYFGGLTVSWIILIVAGIVFAMLGYTIGLPASIFGLPLGFVAAYLWSWSIFPLSLLAAFIYAKATGYEGRK
jgi:hypothetical protein